MDAHFFRKLANELNILDGARIEKIHSPASDILTIQFFLPNTSFINQKKLRLYLRFGRKEPLLFLSQISLPNPAVPPAWVMRLRKYVQDRKLGTPQIDWVSRCIAFSFLPPKDVLDKEKTPPTWFMLDLKEGPKLLKDLPAGFGNEPIWPQAEELADLLNSSQQELTKTGSPVENESNKDVWSSYPVLTPSLRKNMLAMDILDAQALLIDLQDASGDIFVYKKSNEAVEAENSEFKNIKVLSAWPLEQEKSNKYTQLDIQGEQACLVAARDFGEQILLTEFGAKLETQQAKPIKTAHKKFQKLLKKLEDEEQRLLKMRDQRKNAILLQANLYKYNKDEKLASITLEAIDFNQDNPAKTQTISLDPKITMLQNMTAFFKNSERGERGLKYLVTRKILVKTEFEASLLNLENVPNQTQTKKQLLNNKKQKTSNNTQPNKLYSMFKSSDGYTMLIGKNSKGNHDIMRLAQPHDYWLHSEIGQSAHLIIRRKHTLDEVPERTMKEAGILVGLKSWQSADTKANIMCALGKDINPMKGAKAGTARINKLLQSFTVDLDQALPDKLIVSD